MTHPFRSAPNTVGNYRGRPTRATSLRSVVAGAALSRLVLKLDAALPPGDVECMVETEGKEWAALVKLAKRVTKKEGASR